MEYINWILNNQFLKTFLILTGNIFAGYALHPVPKVLDNLFTTSPIFKFIILFIAGIALLHPIDKKELVIILGVCVLILLIFDRLRKIE